MTMDSRTRWFALYVLCLGSLMIVLDATIVNVALPSIRTDLGFSETSLAWVVNAYVLTFGGFLLLGGRLGDLYGHRRLFIAGITLFTLASLALRPRRTRRPSSSPRGPSRASAARVASAVGLSLMMTLFTEPAERAKAMGVFGFVASGGGSDRRAARRRPDELARLALDLPRQPPDRDRSDRLVPAFAAGGAHARRVGATRRRGRGDRDRRADARRLRDRERQPERAGRPHAHSELLAAAVALLGVFFTIESRVSSPLMPLGLLRLRNMAFANVAGILWAAAMFAWFFLSALYLQLVLGYSPLQVGLAFLPANLIMGAFSIGLSAKLVMRFGIKPPLGVGLGLAACGLALFARAPVHGSFLTDVLPSMILLGIGAGIAFNPILLAAMSDVAPEEAGLASGVVNTAFMMGGALGLAVLASLAAHRTGTLRASGHGELASLVGGYHAAFIVGAIFAAAAATVGVTFLRSAQPAYEHGEVPAGAEYS